MDKKTLISELKKEGIQVKDGKVKKSDILAAFNKISSGKEEYVIVNDKGEFWTGTKYVDEYPEGKIYTSEKQVIKEAEKAKGKAVKNYGLVSEEVVGSSEQVKKFTNSKGDEYAVRVVYQGDKYGLDFKLTHDKPEPLVEFYDTEYRHTKYGQFVSRYYLSTLLKDAGWQNRGLDLQGDIPKWKIDAETMQKIIAWLKTVGKNEVVGELDPTDRTIVMSTMRQSKHWKVFEEAAFSMLNEAAAKIRSRGRLRYTRTLEDEIEALTEIMKTEWYGF
jgi:hypothetical protein